MLNHSKYESYEISNNCATVACGHEKGSQTHVEFVTLFVIRLGFEPKTHSLEGCCSIQLSYQTCLLCAFAHVLWSFPLLECKVNYYFLFGIYFSPNFYIKNCEICSKSSFE